MGIEMADKEGYIFVCRSDEVYEGKGKQIIFKGDDDFQLAVFRVNGRLYCLDNICPHRHSDRIFEGIIKGGNVICPLHGWTYSLETGENIDKSQGIKSLRSHDIYENDGSIFVRAPEFEIPVWRR